MILFKPEHIEPILNDKKTQTRRIWKTARVKVGSIQKAKTKMLSKDYFAKLRILRVFREYLNDISEEDARAEGYKDREDYIEAFHRINKTDPATNPLLYVVYFKRVKEVIKIG